VRRRLKAHELLARRGLPSLISVSSATRDGEHAFLFDLASLGKMAFDAGLAELFAARSVFKVFPEGSRAMEILKSYGLPLPRPRGRRAPSGSAGKAVPSGGGASRASMLVRGQQLQRR
jgi:hypothetical protein